MNDDYFDDGTMPANVEELRNIVVGRRITKVECIGDLVVLTLDNDTKATLRDTDDCCAYTKMTKVIQHMDHIDHVITDVTADKDYNTWHILADGAAVVELMVDWSPGNPFYYMYGFAIDVQE
jgi:hypothetical protein